MRGRIEARLERRGETAVVEAAGRRRTLDPARHEAWLDLYAELSEALGTRLPLARRPRTPPRFTAPLKPMLTENLAPGMRYGYGDPAVLKVGDRWWLYVTSNDAPDAFPILSSPDLTDWRFEGFVFPAGEAPIWTLTGEDRADFWAPELHRVGEGFWLVFAARRLDGELAVGLAVADDPRGPFRAQAEPLVDGGVIDPHLVILPDGAPVLIWKEDNNHLWPRAIATLIRRNPSLADRLFPEEADRRTAELCSALFDSGGEGSPMEGFFVLQPLIEAAADDYGGFRRRVAALAADEPLAAEALQAMTTRLLAQRLSPDGSCLQGERRVVLENDLDWEAHLIEGVWISEIDRRWWLFYAANDFSTDHYGIGAAVADHPLGPYRKLPEPLLRSTPQWSGPGHPSVTTDRDGRPLMVLHGFAPGRTGYKVFRALLSISIESHGEELRLV